MIKNVIDFEKLFNQKFGDIDRSTLSSLIENKLRFDLGGKEVGLERIKKANDRSNQILQYCFDESPIWLRIILWDEKGEINLRSAGLDIESADNYFRDYTHENVLYLHFEKFPALLNPVVTSIINYDMAEEPSANITCYFIDFDKSVIINIYDDRGMDVYSPNKIMINNLKNKFHKWLI